MESGSDIAPFHLCLSLIRFHPRHHAVAIAQPARQVKRVTRAFSDLPCCWGGPIYFPVAGSCLPTRLQEKRRTLLLLCAGHWRRPGLVAPSQVPSPSQNPNRRGVSSSSQLLDHFRLPVSASLCQPLPAPLTTRRFQLLRRRRLPNRNKQQRRQSLHSPHTPPASPSQSLPGSPS